MYKIVCFMQNIQHIYSFYNAALLRSTATIFNYEIAGFGRRDV